MSVLWWAVLGICVFIWILRSDKNNASQSLDERNKVSSKIAADLAVGDVLLARTKEVTQELRKIALQDSLLKGDTTSRLMIESDYKELERQDEWEAKLKQEKLKLGDEDDEESAAVLQELMSMASSEKIEMDAASDLYAKYQTLKYLRKAKETNPVAMLALAKALRYGQGVEVSYLKSYLWGKLALIHGVQEATWLIQDHENFLLSPEQKLHAHNIFEKFVANFPTCDIESLS